MDQDLDSQPLSTQIAVLVVLLAILGTPYAWGVLRRVLQRLIERADLELSRWATRKPTLVVAACLVVIGGIGNVGVLLVARARLQPSAGPSVDRLTLTARDTNGVVQIEFEPGAPVAVEAIFERRTARQGVPMLSSLVPSELINVHPAPGASFDPTTRAFTAATSGKTGYRAVVAPTAARGTVIELSARAVDEDQVTASETVWSGMGPMRLGIGVRPTPRPPTPSPPPTPQERVRAFLVSWAFLFGVSLTFGAVAAFGGLLGRRVRQAGAAVTAATAVVVGAGIVVATSFLLPVGAALAMAIVIALFIKGGAKIW